jgi:hypothetical protein
LLPAEAGVWHAISIAEANAINAILSKFRMTTLRFLRRAQDHKASRAAAAIEQGRAFARKT